MDIFALVFLIPTSVPSVSDSGRSFHSDQVPQGFVGTRKEMVALVS